MNNLSSRFRFSGIVTIVLIMLVAFLIRTFGYGLYRVPSESMESTMLVGEFFFANKFSLMYSKPQAGDIVAFNDPTYQYSHNGLMNLFQRFAWGPSNWTKRIIGVPGDSIQGVVEDGRAVVYRNGVKLDEPYINMELASSNDCASAADNFSALLQVNQYWVMGDNRRNSQDSRYFGPLDGKLIHGKIIFRLASIDNRSLWKVVAHPIDFWKSIRWERCAQRVI